jgi:ribosomal 50S subunit-associated protein YjgA (DUF615 family)
MPDAIASHETNLNEIILCAAQDRELDGHGDLTDIHLHTILRELYRNHAAGLITKEDAAKRKEQYVAAYKNDKTTLEQYRKAITEWHTKVRNAEQTGIILHKAESLRDFAVGAAKIIELLTGDTGLVGMAEKLPDVNF